MVDKLSESELLAHPPEWLKELNAGRGGMTRVLLLFADWLEERLAAKPKEKTKVDPESRCGFCTQYGHLSDACPLRQTDHARTEHAKDIANWGPAPKHGDPGYDHFARLIGKLCFILDTRSARPWTSTDVITDTLQMRIELDDVKKGYHALDRNWSSMHNMAMDAIRDVIGNKEATVPEIVAFIETTRKRLRDVVREKTVDGAYEALDAAFPEFKFAGIDNGIKNLAEQRDKARDEATKVRQALEQMTYLYEREHEPWPRPEWLQVALGTAHEESVDDRMSAQRTREGLPARALSDEAKPKEPHPLASLPEYVQQVGDHVHYALIAVHEIDGEDRKGIREGASRKAFAKALDHLASAQNIIQREWEFTRPVVRDVGKPKPTVFSCSASGCEATTETPYANGWTRAADHWACKDHSTVVMQVGVPRDGYGSLLLVHQVNDLTKPETKCGVVLQPGDWRTTNEAHVTCQYCKKA